MPSPRRVFSLRLPPAVRARLDAEAEQRGLSLNQYVVRLLTAHVRLPPSVLSSRASRDTEPALELRARSQPASRPLPEPPSRNGPCSCGSGKKFKRCCGLAGSQKTL
jgi:hypothetical protein